MAYPGQKRGTCDDIMAFFDSHMPNVHVVVRKALVKTPV